MKSSSYLSAVALLVFALFSPNRSYGHGALHIAFDGSLMIPAGAAYSVTDYYESDMVFKPLAFSFGRVAVNPASFRPDNGTAYLQAALTQSLMFSFTNGSLFQLVSVDLAEYSTVVPDAVTVPFVGYRPDGSTVAVSFTTDGIMDGTGPLADFQTFNFGPEFTGLNMVRIPRSGWSLDNLILGVPEPATGSLLLGGGLLLGAWRHRRQRR